MIYLSIVIPAYGAGKYIESTLNSMINQDFDWEAVEFLIINDGSTDNTIEVVNNFILKNENLKIKIISKKNGGLSSARNFGINNAEGNYIWFFDSDDIMESNCLHRLLLKLKLDDIDLLSFGIRDIYGNTQSVSNLEKKPTDKIIDGLTYISEYEIEHSACVFIVKKDLLIKNKIYFLDGVLSEDFDFVLRLYYYCNKITHINLICYNYYVREGSLSRRRNDKYYTFHHESMLKIINNLNNSFDKNSHYYKVISDYILRIKIIALINLLNSTLSFAGKKEYYNKFKTSGILKLSFKAKKRLSFKQNIVLYLVYFNIYYPLMYFKSSK